MRCIEALTGWLSLMVISLLAAEPATPGMHKDVEFAKVGDSVLLLDAFVPEGDGPFPTCILVHGGGFTKGTKQSYITPLFEPLSNAGVVIFKVYASGERTTLVGVCDSYGRTPDYTEQQFNESLPNGGRQG